MTREQLTARLHSLRRKLAAAQKWLKDRPDDWRFDEVLAAWRGLQALAFLAEAELNAMDDPADVPFLVRVG